MPHTIAHARQRLVIVRMLIDLMRIVHKHYAPPDEAFGSRIETLAVGCCVALGTLENKPFSVAKIAAYMHLPRDVVTRRLERLVQHWGVIERRGRYYYLRPEIANRPRALASYREVRRAIQRAVDELSISDAAED
jgi:predicted transcriptional regulator